jgi:hypothetical protein
MPRAADKLAEAEFFLKAMEETRGEQPAFRYYASATITAARSIGLVFASRFKIRVRILFHEWWDGLERGFPPLLASSGLPGTSSLRTSNRILRLVLRAEYVEGP